MSTEAFLRYLVDGAQVSRLGEGDFFGELAALDWGGGFGYPRMATVVASTSALLRVVPAERLRQLVADRPDVDAAIRAAVRERLPRRRGR